MEGSAIPEERFDIVEADDIVRVRLGSLVSGGPVAERTFGVEVYPTLGDEVMLALDKARCLGGVSRGLGLSAPGAS